MIKFLNMVLGVLGNRAVKASLTSDKEELFDNGTAIEGKGFRMVEPIKFKLEGVIKFELTDRIEDKKSPESIRWQAFALHTFKKLGIKMTQELLDGYEKAVLWDNRMKAIISAMNSKRPSKTQKETLQFLTTDEKMEALDWEMSNSQLQEIVGEKTAYVAPKLKGAVVEYTTCMINGKGTEIQELPVGILPVGGILEG